MTVTDQGKLTARYEWTKRFPFSPYDFFGYLIPGSIFFFSIYIFEQIPNSAISKDFHIPFITIINTLFPKDAVSNLWYVYIPIILICIYVMGHIISGVSSLFLERIFIKKVYNYPYSMLLKHPSSPKLQCSRYSSYYYAALFFWLNFLILVSLMAFEFNANILYSIVYTVMILILILFILKFIVELLKKSKGNNFAKSIRHISNFYQIVSTPYYLIANNLAKFLGTDEAFTDIFISKYADIFREDFGLEYNHETSNNFWLPYAFISEYSTQLGSVVLHWLNLYSFARNLSTAFYLAYLYSWISICFQRNIIYSSGIPLSIIIIPLGVFLLAFVMLLRYYYLYYCYYSKFLFRSYYCLRAISRKK